MTSSKNIIASDAKRILNKSFWKVLAVVDSPWYIRYGLICIFLVVATWLKLQWFDTIGIKTPFLLYFGVVILAARLGGVGPALFATIASTFISIYWFIPPFQSFKVGPTGLSQAGIFFLECVLITGFTSALINAEKKISRADRRFRALIENSADAVAMTLADGTIAYVSPAVEIVLGYTPDEFKKLNGLAPLHPDEAEGILKQFETLIQNQGTTTTILHRYLNKKNEYIWVESTLTNLLHDPNVGAIVSNFRNVHERVLLEKQKEDFVGIATHELKTPVTSIKAYTQLMLSRFRKEGNDRSTAIVEKMDIQVNRLTNLINDLLDVTKIQSGSLPIKNSPYDFTEMLKETVEDLQHTTDRHAIKLQVSEDVRMVGDRDRVSQVISNLISNAIKYSPNADEILVSVEVKGDRVELCVKDKGIGIGRDAQQKLFEKFYRVSGPDHQTFPGLGLGLYISSEIIKRQGGRIWV
jgi:PAS domain S-box-containing protein